MTSVPATLAAALAKRAMAAPEEPWLFHRQGYDWNWLSWGQVAEQVDRGAAEMRRVIGRREAPRVAVADRLHPDAVAAALAVEAAGGVALPVADPRAGGDWAVEAAGGDAEIESGPGTGVVLPRAPSRLDRWTFGGGETWDDTASEDKAALWRAAQNWQEALEAATKPPQRWIVLASAAMDPAYRLVLLAWTLLTGAAWVLEHDEDAFVQAVLRNRPNLVVAPGSEAGLLAMSLQEKGHRRWHRIRAVGVSDDAPAPIVLEEEWDGLGVAVVRLVKE